jgi:hypothetical protein
MGVVSKRLCQNLREAKHYSQKISLNCVVEGSETAKQKPTKWQPGSAQAQFGIKGHHKNDLLSKIFMGVR